MGVHCGQPVFDDADGPPRERLYPRPTYLSASFSTRAAIFGLARPVYLFTCYFFNKRCACEAYKATRGHHSLHTPAFLHNIPQQCLEDGLLARSILLHLKVKRKVTYLIRPLHIILESPASNHFNQHTILVCSAMTLSHITRKASLSSSWPQFFCHFNRNPASVEHISKRKDESSGVSHSAGTRKVTNTWFF